MRISPWCGKKGEIMQDSQIILETKQLTKVFPGVVAMNKVDFDVRKGEIHAVIGENGAGKSTLCKMLTGLYQPDGGKIFFEGNEINFKTTSESIAAGISMVYQERNLVSHMTAKDNIMLGSEPTGLKVFLDNKKMRSLADEMQKKLGLDLPLDTPVGGLSAGVQQSIEITRAFVSNPRLLILDEPTASLSEREIDPFLEFVDSIRKITDVSIIFISHKLDEVFRICDRVSVFVEGERVATLDKDQTSKEECIPLMLKGRVPSPFQNVKATDEAETLLEVGKCFYDDEEHDVSMYIKEGEVVGFYGLVGAGRSEFANALIGRSPMKYGDVKVRGEQVLPKRVYEMMKKGFVMTSEMRVNNFFRTNNLIENIGISHLQNFTKFDFVNDKQLDDFALGVLEANDVRYSNPKQVISTLSGGNIQKIIIGRSVADKDMSVLILDEPTVGLDLGAKNDVYLKVRHLAEEENKAVVFISSEIEEILNVTDRVYVFSEGNIVSEFKSEDYDEHAIVSAAFERSRVNE